ncbi:hypothetical protein QF047_000549 [Arthrobacter sp. W4I7]|nr:hypothetical protein [Arthrobacter sp. W4I7]
MLYCGKCLKLGRQSRVIYTEAKGRGGTIHEYFFCRARQEGKCDLPYLPAYLVEDSVADSYSRLVLDEDFKQDVRRRLEDALLGEQKDIKEMYARYTNQLKEVEAKEVASSTLPLTASCLRRRFARRCTSCLYSVPVLKIVSPISVKRLP